MSNSFDPSVTLTLKQAGCLIMGKFFGELFQNPLRAVHC